MPFRKDSYTQESFTGAARRGGIVALQIGLLCLLSVFPLDLWRVTSVHPAFLLMAIYHWAVFRPQTLSPLGAFIAGFLLDLLTAAPPGLNAMTFVAAQWFARTQRRFLIGQSFVVVWLCFFLMSFAAGSLQWVVFALYHATLPPVRAVLTDALLTGLLYPAAASLLSAAARRLSRHASSP